MTPPIDSGTFVPITPNPFITGNPVRDPRLFFGREDDFAFTKQRLISETEGTVMLFVGERRSGKTSILFQIQNGRMGEGFLPVFIDMQAMAGVESNREFYGRMADRSCEDISSDRILRENYDFVQGSPEIAFDRLLDDIQAVFPEHRLIYLCDEAEILYDKIDRGELTDAVLTYIASVLESRGISFILTGSPGMGESHGEQWRRLISKAIYREISFLSHDDAHGLMQSPVENKVFYNDGVLEAIYRLTSGHPYYTQVICTHIVDHLNTERRNNMLTEDLEEIIPIIIDNPPPNMVYSWDEISQAEQMTLSLLTEEATDEHVYITADHLAEAIRENRYPIEMSAEALHGTMEQLYQKDVLERDDQGAYRFRVDLFRRWIQRARSIWRLVDEAGPRRNRSFAWVAAAAAVLLVGAATMLLQPEQQAIPTGPEAGDLWVETVPADVEILVNGDVRASGTPVMIRDIEAVACTIEVRRTDYHPWQRILTVGPGETDSLRIALERIVGTLRLSSIPDDIKATITGEKDTIIFTPVGDLLMPTGEYAIRGEKSGHVTRTMRVNVTEGATAEAVLNLVARVGGAYVTSIPETTQMYLDGNYRGETPLLLEDLPVGTYRVRFEKERYSPQEIDHRIALGRTDTIKIEMGLLPSILEIITNPPGASIYVDGAKESAGLTPFSGSLVPGEHRIAVRLTGHEDHFIEHNFGPGETAKRDINLTAVHGWVRITRPTFGTITIDDTREVKVPPGTLRLMIGKHTLRTTDQTENTTVEITRGDTIKVSLR